MLFLLDYTPGGVKYTLNSYGIKVTLDILVTQSKILLCTVEGGNISVVILSEVIAY
jgi:hypothetical protein